MTYTIGRVLKIANCIIFRCFVIKRNCLRIRMHIARVLAGTHYLNTHFHCNDKIAIYKLRISNPSYSTDLKSAHTCIEYVRTMCRCYISLCVVGKSTLLDALGNREVPIPPHMDIFQLTEEMTASDKTPLQCVMEVDQER